VKDPVDSFNRLGAIYRIPCEECDATYIGETGRSFNIREHQKAVDTNDPHNNIATHGMDTGHNIDWESSKCLSYCNDDKQRLILESWFTKFEKTPLNQSVKLPAPYKRLLNKAKSEPTKEQDGS